jgi:hypothetical protein
MFTPHLDPIFLIILGIAIIENIILVIYCIKVKQYKKELDKYRHHSNSFTPSSIKPYNSAAEKATTSIQSKGEGTERNIRG